MTEALAGAGLMIFGCFAPIVSLPFIGAVNYIGQGNRDGMIIIGLALLGLALAYTGRIRGLIVTGSLSAIVMLYGLYNFVNLGREAEAQKAALKGNPFGGIAAAMLDSIQIQWGWILLLGGAAVTIAAGAGIRMRRP